MSAPGLPPGPLEANLLSLAIGVVVGFVVVLELRRNGNANRWLRGIGFGLLVFFLSVFNFPLGVISGVVVYLLVRR